MSEVPSSYGERDELVEAYTELLAGTQRLRTLAADGEISTDDIRTTMNVLLEVFGGLAAAVESMRGEPRTGDLSSEAERRLNELASAIHSARHDAALVGRGLATERPPLVVSAADGVDRAGVASFPASDPPGWWAGR